jgi:hypothetical protein
MDNPSSIFGVCKPLDTLAELLQGCACLSEEQWLLRHTDSHSYQSHGWAWARERSLWAFTLRSRSSFLPNKPVEDLRTDKREYKVVLKSESEHPKGQKTRQRALWLPPAAPVVTSMFTLLSDSPKSLHLDKFLSFLSFCLLVLGFFLGNVTFLGIYGCCCLFWGNIMAARRCHPILFDCASLFKLKHAHKSPQALLKCRFWLSGFGVPPSFACRVSALLTSSQVTDVLRLDLEATSPNLQIQGRTEQVFLLWEFSRFIPFLLTREQPIWQKEDWSCAQEDVGYEQSWPPWWI